MTAQDSFRILAILVIWFGNKNQFDIIYASCECYCKYLFMNLYTRLHLTIVRDLVQEEVNILLENRM